MMWCSGRWHPDNSSAIVTELNKFRSMAAYLIPSTEHPQSMFSSEYAPNMIEDVNVNPRNTVIFVSRSGICW